MRSKKFGDAKAPPLCDGTVADPLETRASHMCYHAKFGRRSNYIDKIWKRYNV